MISTLDRPNLLERCLAALARGTRRPAEVIVVNQGDGDAVEAVLGAGRAHGLEIVHLRQERTGLAASQNLGVQAATRDVVAVVDDDCVPDLHWVDVVAASFAGEDAPDLVGGRILPRPPDGDRVVAVSSRTSDRRGEHRWLTPPWEVGSGGNFAVRRDAYLRVGGNDERLGTGTAGRAGNDLDLFHRLMKGGAAARYEPALVVEHERATIAERRARRFSYGFGVGASAGRWLRDGDRTAWRILAAWVRLRAGELRRRRLAAVPDEVRVIGGTIAGLWYGLRLRDPWRAGAP